MKLTLSSRAQKMVPASPRDLRSRGTRCLHAAPVLPAKSRSLHAPVDWQSQSADLVGMTGLGISIGKHEAEGGKGFTGN